MDFYTIEAAPMRGLPGMMEVAPWFLNTNSRDLMLRDGDFVAIWNPRTGLWSRMNLTLWIWLTTMFENMSRTRLAKN